MRTLLQAAAARSAPHLAGEPAPPIVIEFAMTRTLLRRVAAAPALLLGLAWAVATPTLAGGDALVQQAQALFGVVKPVTPEEASAPQAVLGRALFWDTRLSLDGKTACVSCHSPADWSSDRRPLSVNAKGQFTTLHSQAMFMAQDQVALRWYGDRRDGAHQAERSITGSMGYGNTADLVAALRSLAYEDLFRRAFGAEGDVVTPANYAKALAAYQRTLRTPAPLDDFLQGNASALNAQQRVGLEKFVGKGCVACHNGPLLGGNSFQKFGITKDYWLATGSKTIDEGRFTSTKVESDKYVYRVPMLRNIAKTAPYFHDGSVATLDEAVRVMAEVQLGQKLSPEDVGDIVAFLGSLTGKVPAHYAAPAAWPVVAGNR
jgi:cytochrome c peroxidase